MAFEDKRDRQGYQQVSRYPLTLQDPYVREFCQALPTQALVIHATEDVACMFSLPGIFAKMLEI